MIYTTGYSKKKVDGLLPMLERLNAVLVDIRLVPWSRYQAQWRKASFEQLLGNRYRWVKALGNDNYNGKLIGDRFQIHDLKSGLEIIDVILRSHPNIVLMCGCLKYEECHRSKVADELRSQGHEVKELLGDWGEAG